MEIVCSSPVITATAKIYVTNDLLDDLIKQIKLFLKGKVTESYWANEKMGDGSTTCVSLRFLHKDTLGHILIEVYMELDYGGSYDIHNCCFYLETEMGLLEKFCKNLRILKRKTTGETVTLNYIEQKEDIM